MTRPNLNYIGDPETALARGESPILEEVRPVSPSPKPYDWTILDDLQEWSHDLQSLIRFWPDLAESAGWHVMTGDCESETIARRSAWVINRHQEELIRRIEEGLHDLQVEVAKLKRQVSAN